MRRLCLTVETFEIQSSSTSKATAQPLPSYESGQYRDRELSIEADQTSGYPSPFPNKDRAHSLGQTISRSWPQSGKTGPTSSTVFSNSRSYVKTLDLVRSSCSPSCSCSCHREQCLKSPEFLRGILGSLFIRYTAMPWSLQRCDDRSCRQRLMRISYTFPLWFWDRAICLDDQLARA